MRTVRLDDLDSRMGPADRTLPLTDVLGAANVALNYYELETGDSFAYGVHAHENQEEIFYVLDGTVTFRTLDVGESGGVEGDEREVSAGELARFAPGEFQRGVKRGRRARPRAGNRRAAGRPARRRFLRECEDCG
ncbi:cupin domain-containing protein, partial [Halobacterium bonnevillei]|uniref:cupin domain-containing protein n=1 Tax=Halobacterium bonnevillei TaxID=2692200 RepID=UPI002D7F71A6